MSKKSSTHHHSSFWLRDIVLGVILISGCASVDGPLLTPTEVRKNANELDGEKVRVLGYLHLGTNGRSVFPSKERFQAYRLSIESTGSLAKEFEHDCLTLINADKLWDHRNQIDGSIIEFQGTVVANYLDGSVLDLQACSISALAVDEGQIEKLLQ